MYINIYVCIYIRMYICVCIYIYISMSPYRIHMLHRGAVYTHVNIYIYIYAHHSPPPRVYLKPGLFGSWIVGFLTYSGYSGLWLPNRPGFRF